MYETNTCLRFLYLCRCLSFFKTVLVSHVPRGTYKWTCILSKFVIISPMYCPSPPVLIVRRVQPFQCHVPLEDTAIPNYWIPRVVQAHVVPVCVTKYNTAHVRGLLNVSCLLFVERQAICVRVVRLISMCQVFESVQVWMAFHSFMFSFLYYLFFRTSTLCPIGYGIQSCCRNILSRTLIFQFLLVCLYLTLLMSPLSVRIAWWGLRRRCCARKELLEESRVFVIHLALVSAMSVCWRIIWCVFC